MVCYITHVGWGYTDQHRSVSRMCIVISVTKGWVSNFQKKALHNNWIAPKWNWYNNYYEKNTELLNEFVFLEKSVKNLTKMTRPNGLYDLHTDSGHRDLHAVFIMTYIQRSSGHPAVTHPSSVVASRSKTCSWTGRRKSVGKANEPWSPDPFLRQVEGQWAAARSQSEVINKVENNIQKNSRTCLGRNSTIATNPGLWIIHANINFTCKEKINTLDLKQSWSKITEMGATENVEESLLALLERFCDCGQNI